MTELTEKEKAKALKAAGWLYIGHGWWRQAHMAPSRTLEEAFKLLQREASKGAESS